jgi:hypothetical protein
MTGVSIGLTAAESASAYAGQQKYVNAETAALQANLRSEYAQGQQQRIWHDQEASQKLDANAHALRAAQGKLTAAASENGVGGLSMLALANELNSNAGHYASDVQYNRDAQDSEIALQLKGFQNETQSQLNTMPQPDALGAALQVGTSAVGAYHTFFPPSQADRQGLTIPLDDMSYARAGAVQ